jgi:hypothetical protein
MKSSTKGFVLAAAITVLFNTALAWAKDSVPALNNFMKSLTGHHWTTHGLVDLTVFIGLGLILTKSKAVSKIDPDRLTTALIGTVMVASLGLAVWYVFV